MKHLDFGSVLIFGSKDGSAFVLDTVFVVGKRKDYLARDAVAQLVSIAPSSFIHATAQPIQAQARAGGRGCIPNRNTYVLYEGATPEEPAYEMFSFVPAIDVPDAFPRPSISLASLNPRSTQSIKILLKGSAIQVRALWESLVKQVTGAGLLLGTHFET